jgi:hypothetical protein
MDVETKLKDLGWFRTYVSALKQAQVENSMWWENIRAPEEVLLL